MILAGTKIVVSISVIPDGKRSGTDGGRGEKYFAPTGSITGSN